MRSATQLSQPNILMLSENIFLEHNVQGDSGGNVNILGGDSIGHCEEKELI